MGIYSAVKVPIVARLVHKGCFICEVEGYAFSHPDGPELDTVFLMEFHDGKLMKGPELPKPEGGVPALGSVWDRETGLGKALAMALWRAAQSKTTTEELQLKWDESVKEQTGEGALSDHLYEKQEAYLD